ncbi:hypothetical protein C1645_834724 [Glomus cerebriforme]|uniref:Uncharacterized protein n=1 Tax=Glomus cerebriforme TaxID=658196 RepID=A0A397SDQ6_9GLOM|nr:hypothetical protein C1645_834724 [Glomus cerebriforme]
MVYLKNILKLTDNKDTIPTNKLFNWEYLNHFFEHIEFQNREASYTHLILWIKKSIPEIISENFIRSDLPNPNLEPEFYQLVLIYQIHIYNPAKYGDPAPSGQIWVVPYHAPTLLIWNAHINIQYVNTKNLGKYFTKYVVKSEPSYVFNISEGDKYREHIVAKHFSLIECIFLLLDDDKNPYWKDVIEKYFACPHTE